MARRSRLPSRWSSARSSPPISDTPAIGAHRSCTSIAAAPRRGRTRERDSSSRLPCTSAIAAALAIAKAPRLRLYAHNWWTLGIGVAVVLGGAALRDWAILSLAATSAARCRSSRGSGSCVVARTACSAILPTRASFSSSPVLAYLRQLGECGGSRCSSSLPGRCRASGSRARARTSIRLGLHELRGLDGPRATPRLVAVSAFWASSPS
jgi:hypothetical protein